MTKNNISKIDRALEEQKISILREMELTININLKRNWA